MEYLEGPDGLIRIPDHMADASLATVMSAIPRGREVEVWFIRKDEFGGSEDGSVGEVVAHLFMPRENWEKLVEHGLPTGLEQWRQMGL